MGDVIKFRAIPRERTAFLKVSSGGLTFDLKGERSAAIGLQSVLDDDNSECDYVIVLGHHQKSYIYKSHSEGAVANTPNLLSSDEYRSFWLLWDSQSISLGIVGNKNPIVSYRSVIKPLNYVMFGANCDDIALKWKFQMAPEIPRPKLKAISGGGPTWVNAGDQLPHGAIIGGYENGSLYIIRARHVGSLTPGKFDPSEGQGYISWGGDAHEKEEFEVLVGYNYVWVPTTENKIPPGAFVAGYSEANPPQDLFIGRVRHGKHVIPGKVHPAHSVCYVAHEGKECAHHAYEILVSLDNTKRNIQTLYGYTEMLYTEEPALNDDNDHPFHHALSDW